MKRTLFIEEAKKKEQAAIERYQFVHRAPHDQHFEDLLESVRKTARVEERMACEKRIKELEGLITDYLGTRGDTTGGREYEVVRRMRSALSPEEDNHGIHGKWHQETDPPIQCST